jgi:hypothetical protein
MAKELNVLYILNDEKAYIGGVSIQSLIDSNTDVEKLNITIADAGIKAGNKKKLESLGNGKTVTISFSDPKVFAQDYKKTLKSSPSIDEKLLRTAYIFNQQAGTKKDFLFIDYKSLITGDLSYIADLDLKGKPLAAALWAMGKDGRKILELEKTEKVVSNRLVYINSKFWNKDKTFEKVLAEMEAKPICPFGALTRLYTNDFVQLDSKYGFNSKINLYGLQLFTKKLKLNADNYYSNNSLRTASKKAIITLFDYEIIGNPWDALPEDKPKPTPKPAPKSVKKAKSDDTDEEDEIQEDEALDDVEDSAVEDEIVNKNIYAGQWNEVFKHSPWKRQVLEPAVISSPGNSYKNGVPGLLFKLLYKF